MWRQKRFHVRACRRIERVKRSSRPNERRRTRFRLAFHKLSGLGEGYREVESLTVSYSRLSPDREGQDRFERKSQFGCGLLRRCFIEKCRYAESEEIPRPGFSRDREGQGKIKTDLNMQEKFWGRLSAKQVVPGNVQ